MIHGSRFKLLLLALMVTASHVALVSHAAAHFQPALEQCELCVSQAQPLAAIPAAEVDVSAAGEPALGLSADVPAPHCAALVHPQRQRAPPASSS
jgi:hypothetical protein